MEGVAKTNRREFIKCAAVGGGGMAIGLAAFHSGEGPSEIHFATDETFGNMGMWIEIGPADKIIIAIPKSEMGQGITTSLAMIIADELGAKWSNVNTEWAPLDPIYGKQLTSSSNTVQSLWKPCRRAGAVARMMLISAAAQLWNTNEAHCHAENSEVVNRQSGQRLSFGSLASLAAKLEVPKKVILKNSSSFNLIGKEIPSLEAAKMVSGQTVYGYDVRLPGMLTAVIARCPVAGGTVAGFEAKGVLSIKDVEFVVPVERPSYKKFTRDFMGKDLIVKTIGEENAKDAYRYIKRKYHTLLHSVIDSEYTGVAVVGNGYWPVIKGRRKLNVVWNEGKNAEFDSDAIEQQFEEIEQQIDGESVASHGDIELGISDATKMIESTYSVPFLAHAPMEPMSCTADVRDDSCEIWVPTQNPIDALNIAEQYSGIPKSKIKINKTVIGGSFGRRLYNDFVAEAVQISKAVGAPVKVLWTREDDIRHDFYRPATYNKFRGGIDTKGMPSYWQHRIVASGTDIQLTVGITDTPYNIPNQSIELVRQERQIPSGPFCGVATSQNVFVTESFLDELAFEGGIDPLDFRFRLLESEPRYLKVLEGVASLAKWGRPLQEGRYQGISLSTTGDTIVSMIAEVSLTKNHSLKVHRVFCAVDCGRLINPLGARRLIEGGIVFGLGQVGKNQITIERGRVQQSNFHDYDVLRMDESPEIQIHFVDSENDPSGVGEIGSISIIPAVTNAIFAATGQRIRKLPFTGL